MDAIVSGASDGTPSITDGRTKELARLGALCGTGGSIATYASIVQRALDAGATPDEIVGTLIDVAPLIGSARLVDAALGVAPALEFDVDSQLESLDGSP
jgi:alkylhydroperoxidase/carboxymuconolactone decarboxylase family protein YurZ